MKNDCKHCKYNKERYKIKGSIVPCIAYGGKKVFLGDKFCILKE